MERQIIYENETIAIKIFGKLIEVHKLKEDCFVVCHEWKFEIDDKSDGGRIYFYSLDQWGSKREFTHYEPTPKSQVFEPWLLAAFYHSDFLDSSK